jgi:signal transduction histidine kinase
MTSPPLILNVDDNDTLRYVKTRILRGAGFEVAEAATGAEALARLKERMPALVLLDVKLPDMNGRSICAEIKGHTSTASIVVLQTSASHIESRHRVLSYEAGADGYLVEPIEPEELVAHVRALLRMRQAEHERQAALEDLREADRRKDEFLAMLAHELRNPLAPIRNAVEILRRGPDAAIQARTTELIGRQTEHLARLVDDLLDMSRIATGKITLQRSVVSLPALVEAAVEAARPLAMAHGHELLVRMTPAPLWVDVDPVRVTQVVGNLLHNAIKFTPSGGRIELELREAGDEIEIEVADNGAGIADDVLPRVFDLFAQGDRTLERRQGGLGIGLSLVKGLVEMHGGSAAAASGGPGGGSTFVVRLPQALRRTAPSMSVAAPARGFVAHRILVVEDNFDAAEAMQLLLTAMGHAVTVVNDGAEAVEVARTLQPDTILLDIGLPGISGYELATLLRGMPETRAARMIAVSGYGQQKDRLRSEAAGFDLHLVKPVDPAQLNELLNARA